MQKSTFTRAGWGHNRNHFTLVQSDVGVHQNRQNFRAVTVTFLQMTTFEHDGSKLRSVKLCSGNLSGVKTRVGICCGHFVSAWIAALHCGGHAPYLLRCIYVVTCSWALLVAKSLPHCRHNWTKGFLFLPNLGG